MKAAISLYNALVEVGIPAEKARDVSLALEEYMSTSLATKEDVQLVRRDLGKDIDAVEHKLSATIYKAMLAQTVFILGTVLALSHKLF